MPEESHSYKDLFLLSVGLRELEPRKRSEQVPPSTRISPEEYYLKDGKLRESKWKWDWIVSPRKAWEAVRYRDWLIGNLIAKVTGDNQDFVAISEPMVSSLDVLAKEFKPDMPNASQAIKQLVSSGNEQRSFLTTLSLGISKRKSNNHDLIVFGAGMRRRTRVWTKGADELALQADVEFFVPFYVAPYEGAPKDDPFRDARSICAGIAISRANRSSIGKDSSSTELSAVRFNFRIPFTAQKPTGSSLDDFALVTTFDPPVIQAQKRKMVKLGETEPAWEKFGDWKAFVEEFCSTDEAGILLNAPIGPILVDKLSDGASIKDIYLNKKKREEIGKVPEDVKHDLEEAFGLLKGLNKWQVPSGSPKPDKLSPNSSQRKLGGLLESLGLLNAKPGVGGKEKYSYKDLSGVTVWSVINRLLDELDGFPLYLKGVDVKKDKGTRMAFALASQASYTDPNKTYFGLAGIGYDIRLKTFGGSKTDPINAKPDGDFKTRPIVIDDDEDDSDTDTIIMDEDHVDGDESPLISDHDDKNEEKKSENSKAPASEEPKKKGEVALNLQLGKWFDGETLEDNWFRRLLPPANPTKKSVWKRRIPIPGIRILPFQRVQEDGKQATYSLALCGDLLSVGLDIKGLTKDGLKFLTAERGPLAYFGLGAIEYRIALLLSADRIAFGIGVKLKDLRLSFGPKEKQKVGDKEDESGDEMVEGLEDLLSGGWSVIPEPDDKTPKTRLTAEKKDKFSISVGYLSPLFDESKGTLDIQLYDEEGVRGKMVWIPIERRARCIYLKHIGIGLKGVENFDLIEGLSDRAQLTIGLTGGLRFASFELGFIGAKISIPLTNPKWFQLSLDGLDVSLKIGPVIISGSFLKSGLEYAGCVTIELPKISIAAMGFYGNLAVFSMESKDDIVKYLRAGNVHEELRKELTAHSITPDDPAHITQAYSFSSWFLRTKDKKSFTIVEDAGKLTLVSPDPTLFIYGVLSASTGLFRIGPVEFTAIALGFGLNRRIVVPAVEEVAEFPLVKLVMGKAGYQPVELGKALQSQLGEPVEDPVSMLEDMADVLKAERGQYAICAGVRFNIASTLDCFALLIVQFGENFELALLGLARFRQPRDLSMKAICYIEMQILMSVNPKEGCFKLQALLTSNSWILTTDCKLTGGFALFVWFAGKHKDDFVITVGGYHPRFRKPEHYPTVPRLGLNWKVNEHLCIKGGVYLAVTPSCVMLGARLEAIFHSGRISAWFTAYLDVIIAWSPLHFELDIGISLRVEAEFFLFTIKVTIAATVKMWGPPVGGIALVDLTVISFPIPFGKKREEAEPKLVESWAQFAASFLSPSEADKNRQPPSGPSPSPGKAATETVREAKNQPVQAIPIIKPNLPSGRNNFNNLSAARRAAADAAEPTRDDGVWRVRADELELAAAVDVPVTTLKVGCVKTNSPPEGVQERSLSGNSMLVAKPLVLKDEGLHTKEFADKLGVRPMGKGLTSVLNVTIVRDDADAQPVDISSWTIEEENGSLPAALWDATTESSDSPEPSAKLIPNCITGLKRLKPPAGTRGAQAALKEMQWHSLKKKTVTKTTAAQGVPRSNFKSGDVQTAMAEKSAQQRQVIESLAALGFNLPGKPQTEIRFRELSAKPLSGTVAISA